MHQEFDLSQELVKLLHDEPFYAALSRRMDKRLVTTIPTAGVRLNPQTESFELVVNPKFFEELPQPQRKGILFHEFWHIILGHVTGRIPDGVNFKAWNIATDLAINSLLANSVTYFLRTVVSQVRDRLKNTLTDCPLRST